MLLLTLLSLMSIVLTYVQVKSDRRTPQQQYYYQTQPVTVGERVMSSRQRLMEGSSQEVRHLSLSLSLWSIVTN